MLKKISNNQFAGTEEQKQKLFEVIEKYKDQPGATMPILQEAQEIYGYLPLEVQTIIAEKFESIISKNITTTRAKDFYDLYMLIDNLNYKILFC